jgi:microsomal dipeptidase-like Zn-dependent dipeptidase
MHDVRAPQSISARSRSLVVPTLAAFGLAVALLSEPTPAYAQACGGPGERACCLGEAATACKPGLGEANLEQFPRACVFGAATCMPLAAPTACGGEGQRACCLAENIEACQPHLTIRPDDLALDSFIPVSGDATCGGEVIAGSRVARSTAICIADSPAAIAEPDSGWTAATDPRGLLRGYHDMHLHLLGDMAHGAKNVVGTPAPISLTGRYTLDGSNTINEALSPALDRAVHKNPYHGLLNDTSGDGTGDGSRTEFGAPYFSGWPKWTSTTHQQTYYPWLERAWRGGLRTTTLFASHVESLCKTSLKLTKETSWPFCEDSMLHIANQLRAARDFELFIDAQYGGAGQGWFRIVTTPQQARDAVRAGKLAVVLGIEVDKLFNCKMTGCPADFGLAAERLQGLTTLPPPETLADAVNVIYDMGVRHVFPVHNFDNGFGAAATWMDPIAVGQAIAEQRWWETRDCGDFRGDYGFWLDNVMAAIMELFGFGIATAPPIPIYPSGHFQPYASCNALGLLQPRGPDLLQLLMDKGMLIDVDHMSAYSVEDTIAITALGPDGDGPAYPLLASHVQVFDLHQKEFAGNKGRHERMRTRAQLDAIRNSGGMVAAMLKDDVQDTDLKGGKYSLPYTPLFGPAVADNCRHSSKSFAQQFQYNVDVMRGPVAMGSDWNGAAGHFGPRFGSDACGGWGAENGLERPQQILENSALEYPFTLAGFGSFDRQVTGFKTFDYNFDGLAHIGLVPDMVADLQRLGMGQHYLDALFCSSEAYIRVWERAAALGARHEPPDPNRLWLCNVTDSTPPESTVTIAPAANGSGWHNTNVVASIVATDADSGVERIEYSVAAGENVTNGSTAGAVASTAVTGDGDRELSYYAIDRAGNAETPNALTLRIDRVPPTIDAARTPGANSAGWNNSTVTVAFTCADTVSGIETCAASQQLTAEGAGQSASGDAVDVAGNTARASATGINIDLTAPVVVINGITDGAAYDLGAVPPATCTTTDALSGVATAAVASVTGGTSNSVGTYSVTCNGAGDIAGNTGAASATFAVHYVFNGFVSPIANLPVVNAIKAGQTVPVKFGLGGNHGLDVLPGGTATSAITSCSGTTNDQLIEVPVLTPGANQFTYDAATGLYQFNWKTEQGWANSCRRLLVRLDDGTVHAADFRLR